MFEGAKWKQDGGARSGIILVLISLSVLIYLGIVGSTPFIGAFFLQKLIGFGRGNGASDDHWNRSLVP